MLAHMNDVKTARVGNFLWGMAAVLLLPVWIASMPLDDDRLCNSVPVCFGLAGVVLLGVLGLLLGARPARPTLTCLLGLVAGLYFLIRCLTGDMLSENVRELPLILTAFVFYGAGYLLAPRWGGVALSVALVVGLVANMVFFFLLRDGAIPIEATGRPAMSLAGANGPGSALFTYRNFAAMFLLTAGAVLIFRPIWVGWEGWGDFGASLVGMVALACSYLPASRSVLALPPLLVVAGWVLWFIIRLYSGRGLGWGVVLTGLSLLVAFLVLLGELFLGKTLLALISEVDTHSRTEIWGSIYSLLPQVPWCGYGAGATQWQLVPVIDAIGAMPNYAHNDYLQVWVDYGIVGFVLMLAVLISHLTSGFWCMASEEVDRSRRSLVSACMLILLAFAGCAVFEFGWHNMALAGMTAFACGVLAAPVPTRREPWLRKRTWASGSKPPLRPVLPMGNVGAALCCTAAFMLALGCGAFAWRLLPAWRAQWQYNALCQQGASHAERVLFLEEVMRFYPDPALVDHYVTLWPPADRADNEARKEEMMRLALRSNPHQLFTVVMLADLLGRVGRCEEAEELMREHYLPGGMPGTRLANWPGYYGLNLLRWGQLRMAQGDHGSALSMMEYALNLWGHASEFHLHREGGRRRRVTNSFIAARRVDVDMLRAIGVEKDDSWMSPMRPGGAPALYEQWGHEAHTRKFADPYAKHSPLKI